MRRTLPVLLLLFSLLCGCAKTAPAQTATIFAMDTVMDLTAYGPHAASANADAVALLNELDARFSATRTGSDIYTINHSGGAPVTVSAETADILAKALKLSADCGGALQLSIYPIVQAWGFPTDAYRVPTQAELDALLPLVDDSAIVLDDQTVTLPDGMAIDLGAVAKGYAADRLIALYREAGVTSAIFSLGGNVATLGQKPDGSNWRVAIQDPNGDGYAGTVEMGEGSLVTSGSYERYFEQDGVRYWHILDPETGYPARSGICSATVLGADSMTCDALSTALFVLGVDGAIDLWRERDDFSFILLTDDGEIYLSEGVTCTFSGSWADAPVTVVTR